jgi:hypothetical protein
MAERERERESRVERISQLLAGLSTENLCVIERRVEDVWQGQQHPARDKTREEYGLDELADEIFGKQE